MATGTQRRARFSGASLSLRVVVGGWRRVATTLAAGHGAKARMAAAHLCRGYPTPPGTAATPAMYTAWHLLRVFKFEDESPELPTSTPKPEARPCGIAVGIPLHGVWGHSPSRAWTGTVLTTRRLKRKNARFVYSLRVGQPAPERYWRGQLCERCAGSTRSAPIAAGTEFADSVRALQERLSVVLIGRRGRNQWRGSDSSRSGNGCAVIGTHLEKRGTKR